MRHVNCTSFFSHPCTLRPLHRLSRFSRRPVHDAGAYGVHDYLALCDPCAVRSSIPSGPSPGTIPSRLCARSPRFTLMRFLSSPSFAWLLLYIIRRNFSLGLLPKRWPIGAYVSSSMSLSIKFTMRPRSPAFRAMRSGAQVNIPLNLPRSYFLHNLVEHRPRSGLFRRVDSRFPSTISNFSFSASETISFTWLSMLKTCCSSLSVLFLAYRQYRTGTAPPLWEERPLNCPNHCRFHCYLPLLLTTNG